MLSSAAKKRIVPPPKERGLRRTGYTVAGFPFAFFGIPTLVHAKKVRLVGTQWVETDLECGGLLKVVKVWVNDILAGYEIVLGVECQDCRYTDSIRFPYSGPKQLFNNTSSRTWRLHDRRS